MLLIYKCWTSPKSFRGGLRRNLTFVTYNGIFGIMFIDFPNGVQINNKCWTSPKSFRGGLRRNLTFVTYNGIVGIMFSDFLNGVQINNKC
jgi:hypothetical protein